MSIFENVLVVGEEGEVAASEGRVMGDVQVEDVDLRMWMSASLLAARSSSRVNASNVIDGLSKCSTLIDGGSCLSSTSFTHAARVIDGKEGEARKAGVKRGGSQR